jgi:hypothetical protein
MGMWPAGWTFSNRLFQLKGEEWINGNSFDSEKLGILPKLQRPQTPLGSVA